MTVRLVEADSTTQVVPQGTPDFKGHVVFGIGNNGISGFSGSAWGQQSIGVADNGGGKLTAIGMAAAGAGLDGSGAGTLESSSVGRYHATLETISSVFAHQVAVEMECAELDLTSLSLPGTGLLATLILGGGDDFEYKIGYFAISATGPVAVTGVGFQPDLLLLFSNCETPGGPISSSGFRQSILFGATDGTNQWCQAAGTRYNFAHATYRTSMFSTSHLIQTPTGLNTCVANISSMNADGFTLNCTTKDDPIGFFYLAIKDPDGLFAVGTGTEGDAAIAVGFEAEAVITGTSGGVDTTTDPGMLFGLGVATPGLSRAGFAAGSAGGVEDSYWQDAAIAIPSFSGSSPALQAKASVSAWNEDDITLNWTTGGGGGRLFGWVALRTSEGRGWNGCGFIPAVSFDRLTFARL